MQVPAREIRLPLRMRSLAASVALLEKLDHQPRTASATQYRQVAGRVAAMLREHAGDAALADLLSVSPAATELYENLHYDSAGLCRSDLDGAVQAEVLTQQLLQKLKAS